MRRYSVPRVVFVNKLDRVGANPWKVIAQARDKLKLNAAAVQVCMSSLCRLASSFAACSVLCHAVLRCVCQQPNCSRCALQRQLLQITPGSLTYICHHLYGIAITTPLPVHLSP